MCGIIGHIGSSQAPRLIEEEAPEYRGYTCGVALHAGDAVVRKSVGRVAELAEKVADGPDVTVGMAHTLGDARWRYGSDAHPHVDESGRIAVVHNGIVENVRMLRANSRGGRGLSVRNRHRSCAPDLASDTEEPLTRSEMRCGCAAHTASWSSFWTAPIR